MDETKPSLAQATKHTPIANRNKDENFNIVYTYWNHNITLK